MDYMLSNTVFLNNWWSDPLHVWF